MNKPFIYGGQYVPNVLVRPLQDFAECFNQAIQKKEFTEQYSSILRQYVGRPSPLTEAKNLSLLLGGARIFLKREDLLHTGAHKINNAIGQCLLAKYLHKKRIVAETGAGQHGVATATAAAYLGLECTIYMGVKDIDRQRMNVERMRYLGATITPVSKGRGQLNDAVDAAFEDFIENYANTHFLVGSALGPYPYPEVVRYFQSVISSEIPLQLKEYTDQDPDVMIACVGGGSNAIGFFHHYINCPQVRLIGVEGGGLGPIPEKTAARFAIGKPGIYQGFASYVIQDEQGGTLPSYSIAAGLDYSSVGPDHAKLHDAKRAEYTYATDEEALNAFQILSRTEGIIPALESSHAVAHAIKVAPDFHQDQIMLVNISGRGDKDLAQIVALSSSR